MSFWVNSLLAHFHNGFSLSLHFFARSSLNICHTSDLGNEIYLGRSEVSCFPCKTYSFFVITASPFFALFYSHFTSFKCSLTLLWSSRYPFPLLIAEKCLSVSLGVSYSFHFATSRGLKASVTSCMEVIEFHLYFKITHFLCSLV